MDDLTREIARTIWETSRRDEGTISATGANIVAAALAPLIEARVREARADELERAAKDYPNHVRGEDEFWSYNTTTDAVEEIGVEYMTQRAEEVRRG